MHVSKGKQLCQNGYGLLLNKNHHRYRRVRIMSKNMLLASVF